MERNRCKRRLKAALDFFMSNIRPGFNLILVARREALFTPFEMLKGEIERSVRKAGLWQDKAEAAEA